MNNTDHPSTPFSPKSRLPGLAHIQNIIAVASGKGGVGKSTVAANLAISMFQAGYKVGLLDADIYGPSQYTIFGATAQMRPKSQDGKIQPVSIHGISFMSMGLVLEGESPVVWRAPMVNKAITQFLNVDWGHLDYLFIDLPPGTGDIQITLSQQASLTGAIIVTTPQQVALGIARRGLQMFQQVNIPILGIIENMSGFTCGHCGKVTPIFKEGGGYATSEELNVPFLGAIPLSPQIMESSDAGRPLLLSAEPSAAKAAFEHIASTFLQQVQIHTTAHDPSAPTQVTIDTQGQLALAWADGLQGTLLARTLRLQCPCASCQDENTGKRILDPQSIPLNIALTEVNSVGRYGIAVNFNYPHSTGIYRFPLLRSLLTSQLEAQKNSFSL